MGGSLSRQRIGGHESVSLARQRTQTLSPIPRSNILAMQS